jgi:DNA polymerase-3 subunit alpha
MLAVLEQAQSAGQKAQQDAQIGQASIFDLFGGEDDTAAGGGPALGKPSHAPIPDGEFERAELLTMEKESIGLYISEHPLKGVAAAMAAETDCTLGRVSDIRDGERVTLGGMLNQIKRLRTKKGDPMMFATLADLEGSVELIVFGQTLEECGDALEEDKVLLVQGRLEHKDKSRTCVVVQSVERFEPTEEELERAEQEAEARTAAAVADAFKIRLDATALPIGVIADLRDLLINYPGESDVVVELATTTGARRLRLGADYRVQRNASLQAEIASLFGSAILAPDAAAGAAATAA